MSCNMLVLNNIPLVVNRVVNNLMMHFAGSIYHVDISADNGEIGVGRKKYPRRMYDRKCDFYDLSYDIVSINAILTIFLNHFTDCTMKKRHTN